MGREQTGGLQMFKVLAVFSIGVATGAAIALAYAPRTGDKTRKQWKRKMDDTSEYLRDTADDFAKHANKVYSQADDLARKVSKSANKFAESF
jgi:gas vesicle protein